MLKDLRITNVQETDFTDKYGNKSFNVFVDGVNEFLVTRSKWVVDQVGKTTTFEVTKKISKNGKPYYSLTKPASDSASNVSSTGSFQPTFNSASSAKDESIERQVAAKVVGSLYQGRGMDAETFLREATYVLAWIQNTSTAIFDGKPETDFDDNHVLSTEEITETINETPKTPTDEINLEDIPF